MNDDIKTFSEKTVFIKKFFLIYLTKIKKRRNGCIIFDNKVISTIYLNRLNKMLYCKNLKISQNLINDFLAFFILFKNLLRFFSRNVKQKRAISSSNFEAKKNKLIKNSLYRKKNVYLVKNYGQLKEGNFCWFYDQSKNRFFHQFQKSKKINNLFNMKNLLNLITKELAINSIIGFSKKAFQFILELLKKKMNNVILKIGTIANQRQSSTEKIFDVWGHNNIICKKNRIYNHFQSKFTFKVNLKNSIRKYKMKKKIIPTQPEKISDIENSGEKNRDSREIKKDYEIDDALFRANKTLMTLLNEILQNRVEELKKATLCLESYKPSEIKYFPEKKEQKKQEYMSPKKEIGKLDSELKEFRNFTRSNLYLSGIDCFLFLKENENYENENLSMALLIILMSDFNLKFSKKMK